MEEILLYKALACLTPEEYKLFMIFVDSPFFNSEKKVVALLSTLSKHHPKFAESKSLLAANQIKKLGLNSEGSLRNLRSRVLKLLMKFLTLQALEKHPNTERLLLLDALLDRKIKDLFREKLHDLSELLESDKKNENKEDNMHQSRFLLADFRLQGLLQGWESPMVFQNYMDNCDAYFLLNKIKVACQFLLFQHIEKQPDNHLIFDELAFLLPFHDRLIAADPTLLAWKMQYELLKNPFEKNDFEDFLVFFHKNSTQIPVIEQRHLYNTAHNFFIGRLNAGHFNTLSELKDYYARLLVLYKFAAEQNLLLEADGSIPQQRFKNVISAACNAGDVAWAKLFLDQKLAFVLPKDQDDLRLFCLGAIGFYKRDYKTAAKNLSCVSPHGNDFYYFDIATLQSRIFYVENEFDPLEKKAETVRRKLQKTQVSKQHSSSYANFFKMLRKLFKLKYDPNQPKSARLQLRKAIEDTNPIAQKKWLLEACDGKW